MKISLHIHFKGYFFSTPCIVQDNCKYWFLILCLVQGPNQENTDSENVEVFKRTHKKEFSKRLEKHQLNAERPQEGRRTAWCNVLGNIIVTTVFLIGAVLLALGIGGVFNIVAGIATSALSVTIAVFVLREYIFNIFLAATKEIRKKGIFFQC